MDYATPLPPRHDGQLVKFNPQRWMCNDCLSSHVLSCLPRDHVDMFLPSAGRSESGWCFRTSSEG